jgi:hypothetical protein
MDNNKDEQLHRSSDKVTLTKNRIAVILAVFVLSLIIVGLLAGMLRPTCNQLSSGSAASALSAGERGK